MNTQRQSFPLLAKALGYGGLIPFVVLSACEATGINLATLGIADAAGALLVYAAVIISFIGAVHWGVALQITSSKRNLLFVYSVIPVLVAWLLMFFSLKVSLLGLGLTIVAMLFVDRWLLSDFVSPDYLKMRVHLSFVVAVCLFLAAFRVDVAG